MNTKPKRTGVLGATSLVGQALLPLLSNTGAHIVAYTRKEQPLSNLPCIEWRKLPANEISLCRKDNEIPYWICAAPIWVLPDHFEMLEKHGAERVVVISSTSRFTKSDSTSDEEKDTASRLSEMEDRLAKWAKENKINWIVLRPTLIYGWGQDKNISELIRLIRRFGFFPLPGEAKGLRQPVHADDVAAACVAALERQAIANCAYNLSGGETLTYREMVTKIFASLGLPPRLLVIPPKLLYLLQVVLRMVPRYRQWNLAMVDRMNADLVFDHSEAARDLNFKPRKFILMPDDLPKKY